MKSVIRRYSELGDELVLAPERWLSAPDASTGVALGELVEERIERVQASVILDVTHARDGYVDLPAVLRASAEPGVRSSKKRAIANDVIVSRLRPYLRQVALVHPSLLAHGPLALSTEFYVLAAKTPGEDVAWLVPWLLAPATQATLAAAQEGGHHPRVPRASLFALRVPDAFVARRAEIARATRAALDALYAAMTAWSALIAAE